MSTTYIKMKTNLTRSERPWFLEESINYVSLSQFVFLHLACLLVFWTGVSWFSVTVCAALYFIRLFGITAGYHRYFSHRSFQTGRLFQFVLAIIGASAYEKGPLWWAANHRSHHMYADTDEDVHSPIPSGFWWSHCGWFLCRKNDDTKVEMVSNLMKYGELRFLDRFFVLPPILLAISLFVVGNLLGRHVPWLNTSGLQLLVWGFFINTVLVHHATFTVTSIAHKFGNRRFRTKDTSRNNLLVALLTFGEGWHNNHHYYPASERQGFFWWEVDVTHYVLKGLSWLGIVWDLKKPPLRVYDEAKVGYELQRSEDFITAHVVGVSQTELSINQGGGIQITRDRSQIRDDVKLEEDGSYARHVGHSAVKEVAEYQRSATG